MIQKGSLFVSMESMPNTYLGFQPVILGCKETQPKGSILCSFLVFGPINLPADLNSKPFLRNALV